MEHAYTPHGGASIGKAMFALALGALLGALAALPYDHLLGLSATTCTVLRSLTAACVLAGLNTRGASDLVFAA